DTFEDSDSINCSATHCALPGLDNGVHVYLLPGLQETGKKDTASIPYATPALLLLSLCRQVS
ncbi:MAG TPA: hypothetical protein VGT82_13925, partial [Ktedonobacteraceae bacterium]|nr:hypothetical protein [Ktedonobacteraceae bacterium]